MAPFVTNTMKRLQQIFARKKSIIFLMIVAHTASMPHKTLLQSSSFAYWWTKIVFDLFWPKHILQPCEKKETTCVGASHWNDAKGNLFNHFVGCQQCLTQFPPTCVPAYCFQSTLGRLLQVNPINIHVFQHSFAVWIRKLLLMCIGEVELMQSVCLVPVPPLQFIIVSNSFSFHQKMQEKNFTPITQSWPTSMASFFTCLSHTDHRQSMLSSVKIHLCDTQQKRIFIFQCFAFLASLLFCQLMNVDWLSSTSCLRLPKWQNWMTGTGCFILPFDKCGMKKSWMNELQSSSKFSDKLLFWVKKEHLVTLMAHLSLTWRSINDWQVCSHQQFHSFHLKLKTSLQAVQGDSCSWCETCCQQSSMCQTWTEVTLTCKSICC